MNESKLLAVAISVGLIVAQMGSAGIRAAADAPIAPGTHAGRRILHVDSYHAGNEWNDRIRASVSDTLKETGVELRFFFLDAKRHPSEEANQAAALAAREEIDRFRPDVVTASDDNAAKYLIAPYYKDASLPFVFCGLNWDASAYGLPYSNVTGMVEVSPIPQIIQLLRKYAKGDRLGYIAENTLTKRKELEYHQSLFGVTYQQVYLANTMAEWKAGFLRAQQEVDMLMVLGVGAVADWDAAEATRFALEHSRVPAGTDFSWLMGVALLGVAKVPEEQGRWAARAALKVLDGVPPSRIPVTYNREGRLYFNQSIAARLQAGDPPPLAELVR